MPTSSSGGDGSESVPGGSGSGTTEQDIPPDVPPDTQAAVTAAINLKSGVKGAFTDLSEHARKIVNGQRLAAGELVAGRKVRALADVVAAGILANNVKSTNRPVTGLWGVDDQSIAQQILAYLDAAGIMQDETT